MKHISFARIVELYLVLTLGAIILVMNSPFLYQHLIVIPINFDVDLMRASLNTSLQFLARLNTLTAFLVIAAYMSAIIYPLVLSIYLIIRALRIR